MTSAASDYLVINDSLTAAGRIAVPSLDAMTERHHIHMPLADLKPSASIADEAVGCDSAGVVLMLGHGLPNRAQMRLASRCVMAGRRILFYWPDEKAVEAIDAERLSSLRWHRLAMVVAYRLKSFVDRRRQRQAVQMPMPLAALGNTDAAVLAETSSHIGREAESLEIHLKGGIAELRRAALAHAEQIEQQLAAATGQLQALLASDGAAALSLPVASVIRMIEAAAVGGQGVRAFGDSLAGYFEGGLAVLDRVKQQSSSVQDGIGRLGAPAVVPTSPSAGGPYGEDQIPAASAFLRSIAEDPRPVPFTLDTPPAQTARLPGAGIYLRLDFWAPLTSGGSYGHTCYQAKALADTTQDFVAVMANHFQLLDDLGVRQVSVPALDMTGVETNILGMNRHYASQLGALFEAMRPTYIFERIVLGNAVGAWASRRFKIPYIVEYNGSEISMKRSFAGSGYEHEDLFLLAEDAAFRQASLISVVSDHVAADVTRRGIPESRILVNPNAVDLAAYSPAAPDERQRLRTSLGFTPEQSVVGFIGTFGGWHGIDVLAASLQPILAGDPSVRFLLIGDGNLKGLVTEAIARHGLSDKVVDVGRVPQARGAELLKACDILISPHSSNMIDSPFFGSPTKLFEYMAMGAGIVASELEQIADVLSPAIHPGDLAAGSFQVTDQRAVLCRPGDVNDFVQGVLGIARHRDIALALGRNARLAAERHYTWNQHVRNLWNNLAGRPLEGYAVDRIRTEAKAPKSVPARSKR
jgi:glycosyltransferase involved in cell wall biosynthesis